MAKQKRPERQIKEVGFIIANEREEFLHSVNAKPGLYQALGWSPVSDFAKVYSTRALAVDEANKLDVSYPVWVLLLLESEGQFAVGSDDENRPPWLD